MESFAAGVASGVIAAFAGFILNGFSTSVAHGFRIRKLLTAEIKETLRGLRDYYPSLDPVDAGLENDEPSFIWDSSSNSQVPDYVTNAVYHLTPLETAQCWKFYDALSRIDAIRDEYNASVRSLVTQEKQRDLFKKIASACIQDLKSNYRQAISIGSEVLLEFKRNHLLIEVDAGQCDADRRTFGGQS
jgi:hypothetical protein